MVQKVMLELAKVLKSKFENTQVYLENSRQGLKLPCLFLSIINSSKKTVAYIEFLKMITVDIQYIIEENDNQNNNNFGLALEILNSIEKLYIEAIGVIKIDFEDVNILDNVLHFQITMNIPLSKTNNLKLINKSSNRTYQIIQELLEEITLKKVFYVNGDLEELNNSFFVIEPLRVETENIGLNGSKQYTKNINIRYITCDLSLDVPSFLEETMDKLLDKLKRIKGFISFNYAIDIEYENEEIDEINVISHELNLLISERK